MKAAFTTSRFLKQITGNIVGERMRWLVWEFSGFDTRRGTTDKFWYGGAQ